MLYPRAGITSHKNVSETQEYQGSRLRPPLATKIN
jgi:hypothetical protein